MVLCEKKRNAAGAYRNMQVVASAAYGIVRKLSLFGCIRRMSVNLHACKLWIQTLNPYCAETVESDGRDCKYSIFDAEAAKCD